MSRIQIPSLPSKSDQSLSYLDHGVTRAAVESMFDAVRQLAEDWPWENIPKADTPIFVSIPELGVQEAVLVQVRHREGRVSIALFASRAHWQAWLAGEAFPEGEEERWSQLVLMMDEKAPLSAVQRKEIEREGWLMPTMFGHPDWYAVQGHRGVRSVNPRELRILEAVTRSLCGSFHGDNLDPWLRIWDGQNPRNRLEISLRFEQGIVSVFLSSEKLKRESFRWKEIERWDASRDSHSRLQALNCMLYDRFRYSPEGYGEGTGAHYIEDFLEIARSKMGCTVAQLSPNQIEIALTDHLYGTIHYPWEEELDFVLDTLTRFYRYLARKFGFDAESCIERLGHRDLYRRVNETWQSAA